MIKTRRRARKSSAGFDTTKLFIGAEGTLGIVTEGESPGGVGMYVILLNCPRCGLAWVATLRLAPLLDTNVAVCQFPNVRDATEAVIEILNKGVSLREFSIVYF